MLPTGPSRLLVKLSSIQAFECATSSIKPSNIMYYQCLPVNASVVALYISIAAKSATTMTHTGKHCANLPGMGSQYYKIIITWEGSSMDHVFTRVNNYK